MSILSLARGTVVSAPSRLSTDNGHATAFILKDSPAGEANVEFEVLCADSHLAREVLTRVRVGDRLVVLGAMRLNVVAGPIEDAVSAARISLAAGTVALDLDPGSEAPRDCGFG
jgi:hypothetical protein